MDIKLTPKDEKLAKFRITLMSETYKEVFAHLSTTEYKQLISLLQKVSHSALVTGAGI